MTTEQVITLAFQHAPARKHDNITLNNFHSPQKQQQQNESSFQ